MRLICILIISACSSEAIKLFHRRPLIPRLEYVKTADDNPEDCSIENVTINYYGLKVAVTSVAFVNRQIQPVTKVIVYIRRCASQAEETNCEHFQTWKFGKEACTLMVARNMAWTPVFEAMQPHVKCPIEKGRYDIRNASFDMEKLDLLFEGLHFENYFWRVKLDAYDYKKFISVVAGGYALRGKG